MDLQEILGGPIRKFTRPDETKPGRNDIVVKTVHFGLQKMIMEKDVPVKMRDGVTLYLNVFRPDKPGKFPVVISADVYGKDILSEVFYSAHVTVGAVQTSLFAAFESPDPGFWVPNDYVVVKADLRGSNKSEGALYPLSEMEAKDYYELIEWAGVQEWSNGNVGMNGVSYLAMTQWYVAALNPLHLKAMIPWEGVSDLFREWSFHAGIPDTLFSYRWWERRRKHFPNVELEDMPLMARTHPLFDEYWDSRQARVSQIKAPMYVCASWSSQGGHNRGTLEGFKQAASKYKWLEVHGRKEWEYYYSREALERQKRFFDYFLKGVENDWLETPRVLMEVRERFFDGLFRYENEYPLARTKYTKLFMDGKDMSLRASPVKNEAKLSYSVEPGKGDKQSAMFKITFDKDTELTGYMKLKLWVSAEGSDDMDLYVGVKKFDKSGNMVGFSCGGDNGPVALGWLRVSHRELDEKRSTPYQPWLKHQKLFKLKEGEIVPVEIEIWSSSTLFRKGESLGLVVQGSDIIPRSPVLVVPFQAKQLPAVNKGKHIIYAGGKYDSHLLVPVIPAKSR